MGRFIGVLAVLIATWSAAPAHASPTDPDADDWVSISVAPLTGLAAYGRAGDRDQAIQIGMDECTQRSKGTRCVTAETTEYGCVAFVVNPHDHAWAGGRGDSLDDAVQDASNRWSSYVPDGVNGGKCSDPITPG
jgi:hypothetical protein